MYTFYLALFNCSTIQQIVAFVALFNVAIVFNCSTIQRIIILQKKAIRTNFQPRNFHTNPYSNNAAF